MAQTKKKRRRKHSGTQAGTVQSGRRPGQKGTAHPTRTAAQRREERLNREPTWRGAVTRASIAAAIFGILVVVVFGEEPVTGLSLAAFMLLLYIPMSYLTDRALWRRRQRKRAPVAAEKASRRRRSAR